MAETVKRMRYFNELFLTQEEFNLEQNYHLRMRRLHNSQMHTAGIINGLSVSAKAGTNSVVTVAPGVAQCIVTVNGEEQGFEIVLTQNTDYTIADATFAAGVPIYLSVTQSEVDMDIIKARGGSELIHIGEVPLLSASIQQPDNKQKILLAKIVLKTVGTDLVIDTISSTMCIYAGSLGKVVLPVSNGAVPALPVIQATKVGTTATIELNAPAVCAKGSVSIDTDLTVGAAAASNMVVNGGMRIGSGTNPGNKNMAVEGNVTIGGNLTVSGTSTTVNTQNIEVEDPIIRVNKYSPQATPAVVNGGMEVFRGGTAPNAQILWDETADRWKIGLQGDLKDIPTSGLASWDSLTNAQNADTLHKHSTLSNNAGVAAVSVDPAGNVGVGKTNPTVKLDVDGTVKAAEFITGKTTIQGAFPGILLSGRERSRFSPGAFSPRTPDIAPGGISGRVADPILPGEIASGLGGHSIASTIPALDSAPITTRPLATSTFDSPLADSRLASTLSPSTLSGIRDIGIEIPGIIGDRPPIIDDLFRLEAKDWLIQENFGELKAGLLQDDGTLTEHLRIDAGGNMGVGITGAIGAKLSVNGTIRATSFEGDGSRLTGLSSWPVAHGGAFYSNGNVGVKTSAPETSLQIKSLTVVEQGSATDGTWSNLGNNAYFDGSWKRIDQTKAGLNLHLNASDPTGQEIRFGFFDAAGNNRGSLVTFGTRNSYIAQGNFGVGTSAPADKLSVAGNVGLSGVLNFGSAVRQMINLWSTAYGIGVQSGTQYFRTSDHFAWFKGGVHSDDMLSPGANGTALMVIRDGNVGIGTVNPLDRLDIAGALRFNGNASTRVYGALRSSQNAVVVAGTWDELEIKGRVIDWTGSSLFIGYANNHMADYIEMGRNVGALSFLTGTTETMRVTGNKVGIGTSTPECTLEVRGNVAGGLGGVLGITNKGGNVAGTSTALRFGVDTSAIMGSDRPNAEISAINMQGGNGNATALSFSIWNGSTFQERLRLDPFSGVLVDGRPVNTSTVFSDSRLKTDVVPLKGMLDKVLKLSGISFEWNEEYKKFGYAENNHREIGLIAQDVETVFPEVINMSHGDYKTIEYDRMVAVLIEAVKELSAKVTTLEKRLDEKN